jgi:Flp pilus assembly protein TadD
MKIRRLDRAFRLLPLAGLLAFAGCQGHGKYTTEGIDNANKRMSELKSATEWDMARSQFLTGDLKKALESVDRSIALNPTVAKSHTLRGRILIELGQLEQASAALEEALKLDAAQTEAHYYLGIVHERFSDQEKALEHYTSAANLDPGDPQHALAASEMLIELGRLDEAEAFLTERRKAFEQNAGVRQQLGHIALMRGDAKAAVARFEEARTLAPDEPSMLEDLALAQVSAGMFAEAEYNLRRIMDEPKNKGRRDLRHAQARCLAALNRPVEARQILLGLSTEEAGKNDPAIWSDLGEVAALLNDMARVRIVSARLMSIAPERASGYLLAAVWQRQDGRQEDALRNLETASKLAPTNPTPWIMRGMILQDLGRGAEAADAFAQALAIDPGNESAQRMFANVEPE